MPQYPYLALKGFVLLTSVVLTYNIARLSWGTFAIHTPFEYETPEPLDVRVTNGDSMTVNGLTKPDNVTKY